MKRPLRYRLGLPVDPPALDRIPRRQLLRTAIWWQAVRVHEWLIDKVDPNPFSGRRGPSYKEMVLDNIEDTLQAHRPYSAPPEPGVDFPEIELTDEQRARLAATREEIVLYARRTRTAGARRRTRRRRALRAAVVSAALLVPLASAAAVLDTSTGVSIVDRLLGLRERGGVPQPPHGERVKLPPRMAPKSGSPAASLTVPWGPNNSSENATGVAYVGGSNDLCLTIALPEGNTTEPTGRFYCKPFRQVLSHIDAVGFYSGEIILHATGVMDGYVAPEVVAMEIRGPTGPWRVHLGAPWTPQVPSPRPLRPFVASYYIDRDGNGLFVDEVDPLHRFDDYEIILYHGDGTVSRVDGLIRTGARTP